MKGLDAARKFYEEYGKQMIHEEFPEYENRIAVGLVGHGSECFGYDDDISKDHDYAVGFCMWLTKEDEEKIGFKLTRAYDKLVKEKLNNNSLISSLGQTPQGVYTIEDFYKKYTGYEGAPRSNLDWLYIESSFLAEATNGEVFRDDLGLFSSIREEIKNIPEDVRLKKMAAECVKMAQFGQYNFSRCLKHNEEGAAMLALSDFVKSAANMIYLINKKHAPYYKWLFRGLRKVDILSDMVDPLEFLLTSDNDEKGLKVKKEIIEDISNAIAKELEKENLADCGGDYLEPYGFCIHKKIKDSNLRNLHILIG